MAELHELSAQEMAEDSGLRAKRRTLDKKLPQRQSMLPEQPSYLSNRVFGACAFKNFKNWPTFTERRSMLFCAENPSILIWSRVFED